MRDEVELEIGLDVDVDEPVSLVMVKGVTPVLDPVGVEGVIPETGPPGFTTSVI